MIRSIITIDFLLLMIDTAHKIKDSQKFVLNQLTLNRSQIGYSTTNSIIEKIKSIERIIIKTMKNPNVILNRLKYRNTQSTYD